MKRRKGIARLSELNSNGAGAAQPAVELNNRSTPALMLELMFHALRVSDKTLNGIAAEVIVRCGGQSVRRLTLEAADRKNSPNHRVRVLDVIGRIGTISDPVDLLDILNATADKNAAVREAASRAIWTLRQRPGSLPEIPS